MNDANMENVDVNEIISRMPHAYVQDGVVANDGCLLYVHIFGSEDHSGALDHYQMNVFSMVQAGQAAGIFRELRLELSDDVHENMKTYARYLLEQELHPEFPEPEILDEAVFEPYYGLGYAWPLENVIDELDESKLSVPWGHPGGQRVAVQNPINIKLAARLAQLHGIY